MRDPAWDEQEREFEADRAAGRLLRFETADDLIADLTGGQGDRPPMSEAELWQQFGFNGAMDALRWHQRLILDLGDVLAGERELDEELDERLATAMVRATAALREAV